MLPVNDYDSPAPQSSMLAWLICSFLKLSVVAPVVNFEILGRGGIFFCLAQVVTFGIVLPSFIFFRIDASCVRLG
jgi:hypothetical protein